MAKGIIRQRSLLIALCCLAGIQQTHAQVSLPTSNYDECNFNNSRLDYYIDSMRCDGDVSFDKSGIPGWVTQFITEHVVCN